MRVRPTRNAGSFCRASAPRDFASTNLGTDQWVGIGEVALFLARSCCVTTTGQRVVPLADPSHFRTSPRRSAPSELPSPHRQPAKDSPRHKHSRLRGVRCSWQIPHSGAERAGELHFGKPRSQQGGARWHPAPASRELEESRPQEGSPSHRVKEPRPCMACEVQVSRRRQRVPKKSHSRFIVERDYLVVSEMLGDFFYLRFGCVEAAIRIRKGQQSRLTMPSLPRLRERAATRAEGA